MSNKRPKIKVPLEPLDIITEIITISLLASLIIYTVMVYQEMPDTIPIHLNANGGANGFSNKITLFMLPMIGIPLYILLFVLNKYPHIHNYMANITEENALKNYRFSTRVVRFTNLFVVVIFVLLQYMMVQSARGITFSFGNWFTPIILVISFMIPIVLILYQSQMNKQ
jgi:uncharacterized membrane protein